MNTLLEMIDEYIRKNGIPFDGVYVSREYFPAQFNRMLELELKKLNPNGVFNKEYRIIYDENGNLILLAEAFKTRIILADNIKDVKVNFPCTKMYFGKIFDKSCIYKYNLSEYDKFKQIIKSSNPSMDDETLEETVSKLIDVLNEKLVNELNRTNEDIWKRDPSLIADYLHTVSLINGYIEYLNEEYKQSLIPDILVYTPEEQEKEKRGKSIMPSDSSPRKYSLICVDDRVKMLEENGYMYKCQARKNDSKDTDTLCYLYMLGENEYEIIIEPYSGEGRTKIIQIHKENEFTYADFKMICMEYLEMTNKDSLNSSNIAMLYHTSKEAFGSSIKYAITRDSNITVNLYSKENIDTLSSVDKSEYSLKS